MDLVHGLVYIHIMIVNVHDAKTHFSAYLARVQLGEEIIVARAGKPVAKLVPLESKTTGKRKLGLYEGFKIPDSAFAPLTDQEMKDWEDGSVFP